MAKKTKDDSQFGAEDEVQGGLMKFEKVGDSVEGILMDIRTVKSKIDNQDQKIYDIQVSSGLIMTVFGRKVIDQKMKTAKLGQLVKMAFAEEGKAKPGTKNKFKLIKVYLKDAPMSASDEINSEEELAE